MYHRICHSALQKPGGASPDLMLVINIIGKKGSASSLIFLRNSIRTNLWNKIKTYIRVFFRCAQGYKL